MYMTGLDINFESNNNYSKKLQEPVQEKNNSGSRSRYKIEVSLDPVQKLISVNEKIVWLNNDHNSTDQLHLHLYANAYKSNNTVFSSSVNIPLDARTQIDIDEFYIEGEKYDLIYYQPEVNNPHDSTVAMVFLNKEILPGDSVNIFIKYKMKIPRSIKRLGYAKGRNFFFVSQWFPKLAVFENGKWICSQYYYYTNFFSDFADYSVNITTPKNYNVGATGSLIDKYEIDNSATYQFEQKNVHDFAWMATDEIIYKEDKFKRKDGTEILIKIYMQPERVRYFERYFTAVKNCFDYFEKYVGRYPYDVFTVIDVPRTSASGGMEYPTLITVSAELISPVKTLWPEYLIAHEFSHQYYYGIIASNEVYEAWLDEGFASYISTKIIYHYYGNGLLSFKFAKYYPVFGLNFLSFHEIPVLYTLGEIEFPEGTNSLISYYRNLSIGAIADVSYRLPSRLSYVTNSYSKPELMLLTLERYLGFDLMMKILKEYYDTYKFQHPSGNDFINIVQKNTSEDISWFFDNFYKNSYTFDYTVKEVSKIDNNIYAVFIERLGDGVFKNEIALYTDKDTLYQYWDGKEKWKILIFRTENNVTAAEIDPGRKNLLDINFANNSYTIDENYGASISLAIRWLFWVQNALLLLGSV